MCTGDINYHHFIPDNCNGPGPDTEPLVGNGEPCGFGLWHLWLHRSWATPIITYIYIYVGGLEHVLFFPCIGNNHPNWRTHIFQRGRSTTSHIIYNTMSNKTIRDVSAAESELCCHPNSGYWTDRHALARARPVVPDSSRAFWGERSETSVPRLGLTSGHGECPFMGSSDSPLVLWDASATVLPAIESTQNYLKLLDKWYDCEFPWASLSLSLSKTA